MVNFMFLKYIDNDKKWDEFLNYKIFSLYSYKKEKRLSSIMLEINKRIYLNDKNDFYKFK